MRALPVHVVMVSVAVVVGGVAPDVAAAPETTVSFSMADIVFSTRQGFDLVELAGCHLAGEPGHPLLPCTAVNFVIPRDKVVGSVKFEPGAKYKLPGRYYIYPAQPETSWAQAAFVEPDPYTYGSVDPYPGIPIEEGWEMVAWGWNTYQLKLWPLEYIPAKGELWLCQTVDISLELVDGEQPSQEVLPRSQEQHEEWAKELEQAVVNPEDVWTWAPAGAAVMGVPPLWALVLPEPPPAQWLAKFEPLILWRQAQGYYVTVGYVSEILNTYPGDTDQQKVRNYLKDQGGIQWALLAGDDQLVPMMDIAVWPMGSGITQVLHILNDWYYCDLDGEWPEEGPGTWPGGFDWAPECWAGRVPCWNPEEAENFVQKVLEYEQYNGDPEYLGRAFYETADKAQDEYHTIDSVIVHQDDQIDTTCLRELPSGGAHLPELWFPYDDHVLAELNGDPGFGYVTVHCHGGASTYSCLTDGYWSYTGTTLDWIGPQDIESLTNQGRYFFWYSISCLNANLDVPDPLLRTVAEMSTCVYPGLGAVAFAGNTETGRVGYSTLLQCYAWDRLFPQGPINYGSRFNHAGGVEALSKWKMQSDGHGATWWVYYCHNLFGDPATPIWTPRAMPGAKRPLEADNPAVPLRIDLLACDPNPAGSEATLRLSFSRPAEARVAVYDVNGRLVQLLYKGMFASGTTSQRWDRSRLPTGVYLVRVEGEGLEATRRTVLLR